MTPHLFPFHDYWWFYLAFSGGILTLLTFELGLLDRAPSGQISFKSAFYRTCIWVALALVFNLALFAYTNEKHGAEVAGDIALQFLTGYIIEESLSVDNLFVFVLIFRFFAVPADLQRKVLFLGILGALFFRGIFIALGSILLEYEMVVIAFGLFLVFTGVKILFESDRKITPDKNPAIRCLKKMFPITSDFRGKRLFVRENGLLHMTPLFVTLVVVELTDIIFAIDSVPAVFAVTSEPLIVFTSNVFAILGLRSLYFLLAGAFDRFHLLKYGLCAVLVFVGLKMSLLNHLFGGKFPTVVSLIFILVSLLLSIGLSLVIPPKEKN
jgi:tellurite resistance protein TerC